MIEQDKKFDYIEANAGRLNAIVFAAKEIVGYHPETVSIEFNSLADQLPSASKGLMSPARAIELVGDKGEAAFEYCEVENGMMMDVAKSDLSSAQMFSAEHYATLLREIEDPDADIIPRLFVDTIPTQFVHGQVRIPFDDDESTLEIRHAKLVAAPAYQTVESVQITISGTRISRTVELHIYNGSVIDIVAKAHVGASDAVNVMIQQMGSNLPRVEELDRLLRLLES